MEDQTLVTPDVAYERIESWLTNHDFLDSAYCDDYDWSEFPDLKLENSDVKQVHEYNYGDGNECGAVFQVEKYGIYFQISGYYSSWDSSCLDTITRVYPRASFVIEYTDTPETLESLELVEKECAVYAENWKSSNQG